MVNNDSHSQLHKTLMPSLHQPLNYANPTVDISRSRTEAMGLAELSDDSYAIREQAINPLVDRAAAELVEQDDKGHKTNIELKGRPYDVLEKLTDELQENGASRYITKQVLKSFEEFALHEGLNFSKQAKARPLYARIMVTDEKPDDLPDVEKFQCVFLDGVRRQGRDASTMGNLRPTIHGTQSSGSNLPGMDEIFEMGKNKGLLMFFASIDPEDLNKFDDVDASLVSTLQAFMGDNGSIDEIEEMLLNGELSPEAMELIEALAEYQSLLMDAATPDAIENATEQLAELQETIDALMSEELGLSKSILDAINARIDTVQIAAQELGLIEAVAGADQALDLEESILADTDVESDSELVAENDNTELQQDEAELALEKDALDLEAADLEQALKGELTLETQAAEDLLDLIEAITDQLETGDLADLPPELQELLESIGDIETLIEEHGRDAAIEMIAEALDAGASDFGQSELSQTLQSIMTALDNPAVQSVLPQAALTQLVSFMEQNADVTQSVIRQSIIQALQASLDGLDADSDAAQAIEAVMEALESGLDLSDVDVENLNLIKQHLNADALDRLEQAILAVTNNTVDTVTLSHETVMTAQAMVNDLEALQAAIEEAQENGTELSSDQQEMLGRIREINEQTQGEVLSLQQLEEMRRLQRQIIGIESPLATLSAVAEITAQMALNSDALILDRNVANVDDVSPDQTSHAETLEAVKKNISAVESDVIDVKQDIDTSISTTGLANANQQSAEQKTAEGNVIDARDLFKNVATVKAAETLAVPLKENVSFVVPQSVRQSNQSSPDIAANNNQRESLSVNEAVNTQHRDESQTVEIDQVESAAKDAANDACGTCTTKDCGNCGTAFNDAATQSAIDSVALGADMSDFSFDEPDAATNGGCGTCTTKDCGNCGTAFNDAATQQAIDSVALDADMSDFSFDEPDAATNGGCGTCTSKDCGNCGTAFNDAATQSAINEVVNDVDMNDFSFDEPATVANDDCGACTSKDCGNCGTAFNDAVTNQAIDDVAAQSDFSDFDFEEERPAMRPAA